MINSNYIRHGYRVETLHTPKIGDLLMHELNRVDEQYCIARVVFTKGFGDKTEYLIEITKSNDSFYKTGDQQWFTRLSLGFGWYKLSVFNINKLWYEVNG